MDTVSKLVVVTMCLTQFTAIKCDFPFQNVSLPFETRVEDLVSRLTLEEVVQQMTHGGGGGDGGPVPPVDHLGIKEYWWGTECIHGDAIGKATAFPQSIGLSATFNPTLMNAVSSAISAEVRAIHNDFVHRGIYKTHTGLNCFSPVINIMRHPLWGRNQETYGEDPHLSGAMAREFVQGLIGNNSRYYRANAVCKHFDAYGGPEDLPKSRLSFNAKVSERDLFTTFLPQFKECVHGGALGVMCSYNSVNGIPACANKMLLTDVLRTMWNFTGFVISDAGAVEFMILNHHYFKSVIETASASANAGLNLELHSNLATGVFDWLKDAVDLGQVTEGLLRERVRPLFYTRMRLGEFDPPQMNPYSDLDLSVVQSAAHRDLAMLAAMETFVLLKNDDNMLPVKIGLKTIAIVGPLSDNPVQQWGNYGPDIDSRYTSTVASGLQHLGDTVVVEPGCKDTPCTSYDAQKVKAAVTDADFVVVCLGTGVAIETENFDRENMLLPGQQAQLLNDVVAIAGGKILLLLFSAGPLDITAISHNPRVPAIIHCFFPAQSTGLALYNVITNNVGPWSNPSGRLPFTWYASDAQVPDMVDYSMVNKTYRYFDGDPLYPFGYGLSYTQFSYSDLQLSPSRVKVGDNVTLTFLIHNTGSTAGSEVSEVYICWLNATVPTAKYQLVAFNRTMIDKSQTASISAQITANQMAVYIEGAGFVVEPGNIAVYVGGQLPNQKTKVPSNVLKTMFTIVS